MQTRIIMPRYAAHGRDKVVCMALRAMIPSTWNPRIDMPSPCPYSKQAFRQLACSGRPLSPGYNRRLISGCCRGSTVGLLHIVGLNGWPVATEAQKPLSFQGFHQLQLQGRRYQVVTFLCKEAFSAMRIAICSVAVRAARHDLAVPVMLLGVALVSQQTWIMVSSRRVSLGRTISSWPGLSLHVPYR